MKLIRKNNKKGFTLVELIVVIAIIAILALILIPAISGYTKKANQTALDSTARSLHTKAVLHISEYGFDGSTTETTPRNLKTVLTDEAGGKYIVELVGTNEDDYTITVTFAGDEKNSKGSAVVDKNGIVVPEVSSGT